MSLLPGFFSYPSVIRQYAAVDGLGPHSTGALQLDDTESLFNLNGLPPVPGANHLVQYILPGLPHSYKGTPNTRLLTANLSSGGSAIIGPPDYGLLPVPLLGDFRGIILQRIGDYARVEWTGSFWSVVDTSPGLAIVLPDQTL